MGGAQKSLAEGRRDGGFDVPQAMAHCVYPDKASGVILAGMKALYRLLMLLMLALPALNVLAADMGMPAADRARASLHCMAKTAEPACHQAAGKAAAAGCHQGAQCAGSCWQLCAPPLYQPQAWAAAPALAGGVFVPNQPARLAGITLTPPHRPPSWA